MSLKNILSSSEINSMIGVHDALSAKIAQNAGFNSLWVSGLGLSTVKCVRDANELSWSEVINEVGYIVGSVQIPVLVDADTGFGDFNNARIFAKKLTKIGASGICIEDKKFPKNNSFLNDGQELENIDEFCGKIKAIKDSTNDDLSVIARTETLIVNSNIYEAVERANAYKMSGADAILIHSKKNDGQEIKEFMKLWKKTAPIIIVPTKYYNIPMQTFKEWGISLVIWANQMLRASVINMHEIANLIMKYNNISNIENNIATLDFIFNLVDNNELEIARKKYLNFEG